MSNCPTSIFQSYDEAMHHAPQGTLVYPVDLGYQVVTITKCPAFAPPRVPLPVPEQYVVRRPSRVPAKPETVMVDLTYQEMSEKYFGVVFDGETRWIGRGKTFSHVIHGATITIEVEPAYARKRGFIA